MTSLTGWGCGAAFRSDRTTKIVCRPLGPGMVIQRPNGNMSRHRADGYFRTTADTREPTPTPSRVRATRDVVEIRTARNRPRSLWKPTIQKP